MHSWSEPVIISNDNPHAKNITVSDGDEIKMQFSASNGTTISIELNNRLIEEIVLAEGAKETYRFAVEEDGEHKFVISVDSEDDLATTELVISIDRQMMLDKLVYPVGILLLVFGLYKRKEEMEAESNGQVLDAELED